MRGLPRFIPIGSVIVVPLLASAAASAQPPPPRPQPAPPAAQQPPPQTPAPPVAATVDVNDPLLVPVPPPPHTLAGWRDALKLVASRSTDVLVAQQEIERARGQSRQALALALPSLTATGTLGYSIYPHTGIDFTTFKEASLGPSYSAALTLTQPLLAPRAWYGIGTAKLGVKSAEQSTDDKKRVTLAVVANAIVAVVTAERVAELNRTGLRASLQTLELTQRKQRLGSGTRLDVVRAQQDATTARSTLVSGDESLLKAREALGLALGFNEAYGVTQQISLNEIETTVRQMCTPAVPDQRSDVLAAKTEHEIASRAVTDADLAFSPTANLSSTLEESHDGTGVNATSWTIQGVLTIPIWEGGARYGAMRIARAGSEEAKLKVEATARQSSIDATQAVRAIRVADQARELSEQTRDLARETARLSQIAFEAGTGTSFDLVDSAQKARVAELNLAVAEFELVKAKIAALLATTNCTF